MSKPSDSPMIREAAGIFFNSEQLVNTVEALQEAGFSHAEIGLLAGQFTVREKLGHLYEEINEDFKDPDAPDTAFVAKESVGDTVHALLGTLYMTGAAVAGGAVVASAGILGGAIAAAAATTAVFGGIGALLAAIIHESDAEYLEEQVDEGHLLLFVRTRDQEKENLALEILSQHAAYNPRVYTVKVSP